MAEQVFDDAAWYEDYFKNCQVKKCGKCGKEEWEHDLYNGLCSQCDEGIQKEMENSPEWWDHFDSEY